MNPGCSLSEDFCRNCEELPNLQRKPADLEFFRKITEKIDHHVRELLRET